MKKPTSYVARKPWFVQKSRTCYQEGEVTHRLRPTQIAEAQGWLLQRLERLERDAADLRELAMDLDLDGLSPNARRVVNRIIRSEIEKLAAKIDSPTEDPETTP